MKSVRLRIAANLVMILGLLSAFLGSTAYCVICMPEVLNIPFHWEYLALVAIGVLLILFVSIALHVAANRARSLEKEDEASEDTAEYEGLEAEIAQESEENANEAEEETAVCESPTKKQKKPLSKKAVKTVAIAAGIAIPIAVAGVAAIALIRSKKKKQAKKKKVDEMPKIYVWIK